MRVIFTPRARAQLKAIHDYIARENEIAARAVIARVEYLADVLSANPHIGFKLPRGRLRRFPVRPYPYLIYFEATEEAVRIVRVRHASRYRPAFHDLAQPFAFSGFSDDERCSMGRGFSPFDELRVRI